MLAWNMACLSTVHWSAGAYLPFNLVWAGTEANCLKPYLLSVKIGAKMGHMTMSVMSQTHSGNVV